MYSQLFLEYLRSEKRYSLHTITAYKKDLEQFCSFLKEMQGEEVLERAEPSGIRSWIVSLIEEGLATRSVNRKLSVLKSYYKYLLREKLIDKNPATGIVSPKISKKLPVFITRENMDGLFQDIHFEEGWIGIRNKLIIELFYATGIRLSELVNLQRKDVDEYNATIKVLGKRNKERIIPVLPALLTQLKEYVRQTDECNFQDKKYLFLTEKGHKIYPRLVYRIVNNYLSQVTTQEKKSPHVLRHTFATLMLNNGADLNVIKEILGHANLTATQVYTHNTTEKLKKIYKQAHPKA